MRIRVLYENKGRGFVDYSELDNLTARGLIVAYTLPGSDEWVDVKNKHMKEKYSNFVGKKRN
jgi:hypothetical protein